MRRWESTLELYNTSKTLLVIAGFAIVGNELRLTLHYGGISLAPGDVRQRSTGRPVGIASASSPAGAADCVDGAERDGDGAGDVRLPDGGAIQPG